jgi:hypothetical protein
MESKKINQLATELTPALSDLTIIGDPTTGISKKITLSQMASLFTGTVEEYANVAAFPLVGVADTIYIALDTNVLYRWDTSLTSYVELSPNIINSLVFSDANGFDGTIALVGSVATLTITTALTTGSVGFIGASGALLQDNANFFWDDTNNRLGIGTNAPTTAIDVFGSGIIGRLNGTSTNNAFLGFASAGTNKWSIGNVQSDHRFRIYSEANTSELVSVLQTGEFGIGIANPTTKIHIDGGASALIANLDADISIAKSISFRSDNSARINLEVSGTESGSNAGANFFIRRYSDAGSLIDTPVTITRSTGAISLATALSGTTASFSGDLTMGATTQIYLTSGDLRFNSNAGFGIVSQNGTRLVTIQNGAFGVSGAATFANDLIVDTNTLYVDSTNNRVGISKLAPYTKLNLEGGHIGILSSSTAGTDGTSDLRRAGYGFIHPDNNLISALINTSAAADWGLNLHFNTRASNAVMSATPAMTITSTQNVLIGTTNDVSRKLHIASASEQLRLSFDGTSSAFTDFRNDSAGGLLINTSNSYIIHYINNSLIMRMNSNGNVLIGSSTDFGQKLQVSGSIRMPVASNFNYGSGAMRSTDSVVVGTSTTNIFTSQQVGSVDSGNLVMITGVLSGTGANFVDLVLFITNGSAILVAQRSISSPAGRTYSVSGATLQLSMASGSYVVASTAFIQGYNLSF